MLHLEPAYIDLGIDQGCFRFCMAHERLKILKRHAAMQAGGGECVPEFVWESMKPGPLRYLCDLILNRFRSEPVMRIADGHKEGGIVI